MKSILITGAGGFIGSHLSEHCVELGYRVKAFIHYNSRNDLGWLEDSLYKDKIEIILGDIRDYDSVCVAMQDVDTVFHLAALIGIPYSYASPLAYIKTNVEGTYNILEVARNLKVENVLVTSTSETYGTAQYVPIDENHPAVGQSPYAATKIAADQLALSYYRSFGLPVKIVRPFNAYGPRQSMRAAIPTIIVQIADGHRRIHLGNVKPTRDLTFVKDTINGFMAVAKSDALVGQAVNIGMEKEISIGELAKKIAAVMKTEIEIVSDEKRYRPEESEVERLICDSKKVKKLTDWEPKYDLTSGLAETIFWFKNNVHRYKSQKYVI